MLVLQLVPPQLFPCLPLKMLLLVVFGALDMLILAVFEVLLQLALQLLLLQLALKHGASLMLVQ